MVGVIERCESVVIPRVDDAVDVLVVADVAVISASSGVIVLPEVVIRIVVFGADVDVLVAEKVFLGVKEEKLRMNMYISA